MNASAPTARAAARISSSVASGLPSAMLSATVPLNRYASVSYTHLTLPTNREV